MGADVALTSSSGGAATPSPIHLENSMKPRLILLFTPDRAFRSIGPQKAFSLVEIWIKEEFPKGGRQPESVSAANMTKLDNAIAAITTTIAVSWGGYAKDYLIENQRQESRNAVG